MINKIVLGLAQSEKNYGLKKMYHQEQLIIALKIKEQKYQDPELKVQEC